MNDYRETLNDNNKKLFDYFKKSKPESNTFIETGCHKGLGLTNAINAGYTKLYSCDIFEDRVDNCINLISEMVDNNKIVKPECVEIYKCNSVQFLTRVLPKIDTDATFWLDAHDEGGGMPLSEELDLIKTLFKNKTSTIIMDDIPAYLTKNQTLGIKNQIKEINPDYKFDFISTAGPDYVMVASIPTAMTGLFVSPVGHAWPDHS
jgi:hypothetical protein